ncbi:MAG: hypothetical protein HY367_03220 [Candidatus Aenigmarchaeota archaeon]|nr:hypothetical protein [Candidatus Aenigmarchaeota archaeon]
MPHRMKGGFELSLSFVVIVVVAVVLLTLAITFLQGIFPGISDLTHKVTQIARDNLLKDLSEGGKVGIAAPAVTEWKRGETGSFAIGLRNDDPANDRRFYISIYLEGVGGELQGADVNSLRPVVNGWLSYTAASQGLSELVPAGEAETSDVVIKPLSNARPGLYRFRVLVCAVPQCTTLQDTSQENIYGDDVFTIEIKS